MWDTMRVQTEDEPLVTTAVIVIREHAGNQSSALNLNIADAIPEGASQNRVILTDILCACFRMPGEALNVQKACGNGDDEY